ncbi:MAG: hypothetical protein H0X31_06070 [Nostocaceae cyanobacterium]|nr:hypothetical protein [Nostocaceae cyanobacterium]
MNFNFAKIVFPPFSPPQPLELLKILDRIQDTPIAPIFTLGDNFPDLPSPRTIDGILDAIESDQVDHIQLLEWLYCISFKDEWDARHLDRSLPTSEKIWFVAKNIKHLKQLLFWDLALTYGGSDNRKLANSLIKGFNSFTPETQQDKNIVNIIKILSADSPDVRIAAISKDNLCTPHAFFNLHKLPTNRIQSVNLAYDRIAELFVSIDQPDAQQVQWLLDCLKEMTVEQEIKAADKLLTRISTEIVITLPALVDWISSRYSPTIDHYRWNQLSSQAKAALNKWKGAVNYGDFQKLVDIILDSSHISLENHERNQLQKRKIFWSHYSDRFERIRILVPQSSLESVKDGFSNQDISVLANDDSKTEVCIFDFKELFVVEFFRGLGSETRIFPKTPELEKILFEFNELSVFSIRRLGGDIHDHVYCWQNSCVRWLMEKGIYPNEGTKFFRGVPTRGSHYDPNIGLPPLLQEDHLQREKALNRWRQNWSST